MKRPVLRHILGVGLVYACIFLGVTLFGLIALIPTPVTWWRASPGSVIVAHQLAAYIPLSILAGLALNRILPGRRVLGSIGCTLGALALVFVTGPTSIEELVSGAIVLACLLLVFGLGVPLTVWIASGRRGQGECP